MWKHGFSYPAGEPGHIHMMVTDAMEQNRSDQGRLRPRLGTGIPLFPWHCIAKPQNQTDSQERGNSLCPFIGGVAKSSAKSR